MRDDLASDVAINAHIGHRVKSARKRAGLTQAALADAIGVTYQQVQKYERGVTRLSAHQLFNVACLLDVTIESLFDGLPRPKGAGDRPVDWMNLDAESLALAYRVATASPRLRMAISGLIDHLGVLAADD